MQTLIYRKPIFCLLPHSQPSRFLFSSVRGKEKIFGIWPKKCPNSFKRLCSSSVSSPLSVSYGGWDDFPIRGDSIASGESNKLNLFLNEYVFVYLFGFVCALAISRVKVSSVILFPACAVVFAIGFSAGLIRKGSVKEFKSDANRRKLIDDNFVFGFAENLSDVRDKLNDCSSMVSKLKNNIRQIMESKSVTVHDLEGYIHALKSSDVTFLNAIRVVESCIESDLIGHQNKEESSDQESIKGRKKIEPNWLGVSQLFGGLFGDKFNGSKSGKTRNAVKKELLDADMNNQKQVNILAGSVKDRNPNSVLNLESESQVHFSSSFDSTIGDKNRDKNDVDGSGVDSKVFENQKKILAGDDSANAFFDHSTNATRVVNNRQIHFKDYQDDVEAISSQNAEVDFSIHMRHTKTAASFGRRRNRESMDKNYWCSETTKVDQGEYQRYSFREMFDSDEQATFNDGEPAHVNDFGSPSSVLNDDLEFNRYFSEANNLLKEAKGYIRHQVSDSCSEDALYKSAVLLSKAIEIRPMSLLAVSQLGNTYLLHGELKLRTTRELRSTLARTDPFSVEEGVKVLKRCDNVKISNKEKVKMVLTEVCEECEDLLIKAGRKFKVALSIDGNDMKVLYNWGLALSFRGQLIADIGPSAARDADKIFMAAIDKFNAMMSRSNDYAFDALFKWGAALQHRSRLRPRNSREKVKLLQQARCLYEDALHMDLGNTQLQDALSSCVSELDNWRG